MTSRKQREELGAQFLLHMTRTQRDRLEEGADMCDQSMSAFVRQAIIERADRVKREQTRRARSGVEVHLT